MGSTSSRGGGMAASGTGIAAWVLSTVPPLRDVDAPRANVAIKLPSRCRTLLAVLPPSSSGSGSMSNGGGGGGGSGYSGSDDDEFRIGVVDCYQGILYEYVVRASGAASSSMSAGGNDMWTASLRRELMIRMGDASESRMAR